MKNQLHKNLSDVVFLEVTDEETEYVEEFLKSGGYDITVGYDFDDDAIMKYGIQYIPATFLIGKDGTIKEMLSGAHGYEEYKSKIDKMD